MNADDHTSRRHTPSTQRTIDELGKIRLQQPARGNLEPQFALESGARKLGALTQGIVEDPPGQFVDHPRSLCGLQGLRFGYLAEFGIGPAQDAVEPADASRLCVDLRFEHQAERALLQGHAKAGFVAHLAIFAGAMGRIINNRAARRVACFPDGQFGIAHQRLRVAAMLRKHRNANHRIGIKRTIAERNWRFQRTEHLVGGEYRHAFAGDAR